MIGPFTGVRLASPFLVVGNVDPIDLAGIDLLTEAASVSLTGDVVQNGSSFDFAGTAISRVTYGGLSLSSGTWWARGIISDELPGSARVRGLSATYDPLALRARGFHQVYRLPDLEGSSSVDFLASSNFDSTLESLVLVDQTQALSQPWDIWVLAGQSNIAASTTSLPLDKDADGWNDQRLIYVPGSTNLSTHGAEQDVIDAMRGPLMMNAISGGAYVTDPAMNGVSPAIRFGQDAVKAMPLTRSLCLVAAAISGTALEGADAAWNPDGSTGDGALAYDNMIARVNAALAAAPSGSRLRGVIWAQGEGDTSADMSSYPAAFAAMRARAETAWGRGQVPWIILLPPPDASRANQDEFLRVQRAMATGSGGPEEQPLCYTVERPAGYMEDSTHVTAAGQRLAGAALAARAIALGFVDQGQSVPLSVRGSGQEVVTTAEPSDDPIPFTQNGVTYTQRVTDSAPLTANMIIAVATPLALPTLSGTAQVGETITATPGLYVYAGDFPGPPTFQWQRDGVDIAGATSLTFDTTVADADTNLTIDETFGGVTTSSAALTIANVPQPTLVTESFAKDQATTSLTTNPLELTLDVGAAQAGKTSVVFTALRIGGGFTGASLSIVGSAAVAAEIGTAISTGNEYLQAWEIDTSALSGNQTFRVDFTSGTRRQSGMAAFSMTDANTFLSATNTANGTTSANINVPEGGAVLAASMNVFNGTLVTWTGATERYDTDLNFSSYFFSAASEFSLAAETGRTVTSTNTKNSQQFMKLLSVGA